MLSYVIPLLGEKGEGVIFMKDREQKEFYLMIKGQKVIVSEEVYRAYVQPIRAEQQKRKRERRCILEKVVNGKKIQFRCKGKCSICEKFLEGNKNIGIATSFDELVSNGFDMSDATIDLQEDYIRKESAAELYELIQKLSPHQQEIIKAVYFDGESQQNVANRMGITRKAVNNSLVRALATLKKFLKN